MSQATAVSSPPHRSNSNLKKNAKPMFSRILMYIEVIKTTRHGEPAFLPGEITHSLSWARHNFKEFEKIHGFITLENTEGAKPVYYVTPCGCKVDAKGDVIITGRDEDKMPGRWIAM